MLLLELRVLLCATKRLRSLTGERLWPTHLSQIWRRLVDRGYRPPFVAGTEGLERLVAATVWLLRQRLPRLVAEAAPELWWKPAREPVHLQPSPDAADPGRGRPCCHLAQDQAGIDDVSGRGLAPAVPRLKESRSS
jgi:hypothetical protein